MPITKAIKTQRAPGATAPAKDKSKVSKTTKDFTEIDTSTLTPDQREMRRRRPTMERERAARNQKASPGPPTAETKPAEAPQAPVDVGRDTPSELRAP